MIFLFNHFLAHVENVEGAAQALSRTSGTHESFAASRWGRGQDAAAPKPHGKGCKAQGREARENYERKKDVGGGWGAMSIRLLDNAYMIWVHSIFFSPHDLRRPNFL